MRSNPLVLHPPGEGICARPDVGETLYAEYAQYAKPTKGGNCADIAYIAYKGSDSENQRADVLYTSIWPRG